MSIFTFRRVLFGRTRNVTVAAQMVAATVGGEAALLCRGCHSKRKVCSLSGHLGYLMQFAVNPLILSQCHNIPT